MVNLKWHDAVAVAAAQFKTKAEREAGWPQTMTIEQLAALQRPYLHKTEPGYKTSLSKTQAMATFIVQECEKGAIQWSTETRQTHHQITRMVPGDARFAMRNVYGEREARPRQELVWATKDVQVKVITAPAFAAWLAAQPETPSAHIAAWFEAVGVNTQDEAPPVPIANPTTGTIQTTKHRDLLAPLVEAAQKACDSASDAAAVFTKLKTWAQEDKPRAPLVGVTEDGRIQWRDSNDTPQELSIRALKSRLKRQHRPPATTPPGKQLRRIK